MRNVLPLFLVIGCSGVGSTVDSGGLIDGFDVLDATFIGSTWGGVAGGADLVLTRTALSCVELTDAAWGDTYYSTLGGGSGVVLRLAWFDEEPPTPDPWAGVYAPGAMQPEPDTGGPEVLGAGRAAEALWFDGAGWREDSAGLVVELTSVGPAGVGYSWRHATAAAEGVAGFCGTLPYWLASVDGPSACVAYVESFNACSEAQGLGATRTPESEGCPRAQDLTANRYLCQAEAFASEDCSTEDGWTSALELANTCVAEN